MTNLDTDINKLLKSLEYMIKHTLKKVNLDNTDLAKSISITFKNNQIVVSANDYIYWVDKGRKPSAKIPPIAVIMSWIKDKGIKLNKSMTIQQFAFAIAKSIAKFGYKGRHFLDAMMEQAELIVKKYLITFVGTSFNEI